MNPIQTLCDKCHNQTTIKIDWFEMAVPTIYTVIGLIAGIIFF